MQSSRQTKLNITPSIKREIIKIVDGLSNAVGYGLEDKSYRALPALLKRDFGIVVTEKLKRNYVKDCNGDYIEINILGGAKQADKEIVIVGECKSQLSKKDVDDFIRKKIKRLEGVYKETFPLLITYMTTEPDVERHLKEKGIALYYSYDFEP